MNAPLRHLLGLTALALALGLAGCVAGTSAPTSFYVLTPTAAGASGGKPAQASVTTKGKKFLLAVGPVNVAQYLDRPQIVSRGDGVRVSLAEFDRWAEPLDQSFGRVLAEDLARLAADSALVVPGRDESEADARVVVDVARFDGSLNGEAVLVAGWVIRDRGGRAVSRGRADYRQSAGTSYASLVEAQSLLVGRLAQDIAAAVKPLAAAPGAGR